MDVAYNETCAARYPSVAYTEVVQAVIKCKRTHVHHRDIPRSTHRWIHMPGSNATRTLSPSPRDISACQLQLLVKCIKKMTRRESVIYAGVTLSKDCSSSSLCSAASGGNSSSAQWQLSEWSTCSQPCGGGTMNRTLRSAETRNPHIVLPTFPPSASRWNI